MEANILFIFSLKMKRYSGQPEIASKNNLSTAAEN